jgi:phosphohistidine phosphatase
MAPDLIRRASAVRALSPVFFGLLLKIMQLYLVQHAVALSAEEDPARPLSEEGRAAARRSAETASRLGIVVTEIRHSSKLRAAQTAEEFERALGVPRREVAGLAPKDEVEPVARELASAQDHVMIVGHQPFLGHLASFLLCGDERLPVLGFENAGLVRLDRGEAGRWTLRWNLPVAIF